MGPDKNPDFFFAETQHIGYQWTPLDPSIQDLTFRADSGPPGHWGSRGYAEVTLPFFVTKLTIWVSYNMGVYGLPWTPSIIFELIWTLGPNFGSKGLLEPNSKICAFVT